jgi:hypothetical protein
MLAAGQGAGDEVTLHLGLRQAEVRTMSGRAISYILRKVNTRRIDMGQSATLHLGCCVKVLRTAAASLQFPEARCAQHCRRSDGSRGPRRPRSSRDGYRSIELSDLRQRVRQHGCPRNCRFDLRHSWRPIHRLTLCRYAR